MENDRRIDLEQWTRILRELNQEGGFPIAMLTDQYGSPIVGATAPSQKPELPAYTAALIQKTAFQASGRLSSGQTDEIIVYDPDGSRLICRPFRFRDHILFLAVLVPEKERTYRRLMNRTIAAIQRSAHW
jgi:predicted regulator of Ras-like GTPase activity (Roadblock/LC7/MglB family)